MVNPFNQAVSDGQKWMSNLYLNQEKIKDMIDTAIAQKRVTEKILETSNKKLQPLRIVQNIIIGSFWILKMECTKLVWSVKSMVRQRRNQRNREQRIKVPSE